MGEEIVIDFTAQPEGPLYARIAQAVCDAVVQGRLKPGDRIPSRLTLAKQLRVNPTTVCSAYDDLETLGVIVSRRGSGSYVQPDALRLIQNQKVRRFSSVTVVTGVSRLANCSRDQLVILAEIVEGLCIDLGEAPPIYYVKSLDMTTAQQVPAQGAVMLMSSDADPAAIRHLAERGNPVVCVWTQPPAGVDVPYVHYNVRHAVGLACAHLFSCGYKRIGYLGLKLTRAGEIVTKFFEFVSCLHEAGLDLRASYLKIVGNEAGRAYRAASELAAMPDRPEALYVDTGAKAIEALHALQDAGLKVPEDIGLMAYDGVAEGELTHPPLTMVRTPRTQIGQRAAQLLLQWSNEQVMPATGTVEANFPKAQLIVGQTTRQVRTSG